MLVTSLSLLSIIAVANSSPVHDNSYSNSTEHHRHHGSYKREGTCAFPDHEGMVAVQKNGLNAGWAMHYDQLCTYGSWCPYACKAGQLMGQWDPAITTYSYPGSQYGGLFCDSNGNLQKPSNDRDYCYNGTGTFVAYNNIEDQDVAFCQTVLPGNEEMLIPSLVNKNSSQVLAVPDTNYWAGTASHFYINPPGVSVEDGCRWGNLTKPWGNWSPYVAGANMAEDNTTYVKIGWNPIYLEEATPFRDELPTFGVRITCDDESQCIGLPCSIDPSVQGVNEVNSTESATGAGGANFCVVAAKNHAIANIEVFEIKNDTNTSENLLQKRAFTYTSTINKTDEISTTYTKTVTRTITATLKK